MSGKIFFRERRLGKQGAGQPRYQVTAVADCALHFFGKHLRMFELKAIAEAIGADLIQLPESQDERAPEEARIVVLRPEPPGR